MWLRWNRMELPMFSLWWTGQEPAEKCWWYISLKSTSLGVFQEAYSSVWDPLCMAFPLRVERRSPFSFPNCQKQVGSSCCCRANLCKTLGSWGQFSPQSEMLKTVCDLLGKCPCYQGIWYLSQIAHMWETELNSQESVQTVEIFRWKVLQNCKLLYLIIELLRLSPLEPGGFH